MRGSNSMNRKHFLGLAAAFVAVALSGCTSFTPVYGDMSSAGIANARFNFAPPKSRLEQVIYNRLAIAFPGPASVTDPLLTVSAGTAGVAGGMSNAVAVANQVTTRVEATVTITQGDQVLFTATRFTDSAYQSGKLTPTDIMSSTGAQETAAQSTAESLRAAILAGYRPGMVPIVPAVR
jgi:hypothetical protein